MSNTGRKVYQFMKQVDSGTLLPTGLRKPNLPTNSDYVAPVVDYTTCPISAWRAIDPFCVTERFCAAGYTLSEDGLSCVKDEEQAATPPTGGGGSEGTVIKINNEQWNNGGARIYEPGYSIDGEGTLLAALETPHFWVNGDTVFDVDTRNTTDGRMNAAGIWSTPNPPINEFVGFSRRITASVAKTVYVGISADNTFKLKVNGVTVINSTTGNIASGPNFNYWHIYPIDLVVGHNYIEMFAANFGGVAGMAAEIYNNTASEIIAATGIGDLSVIFSTGNLVGEPFDLGETIGWSCPEGWSLYNDPVDGYICVRSVSTASGIRNTGYKGYDNRERIVNGTPDGFSEANLDGVGLGTYFPPVLDTTNCPL